MQRAAPGVQEVGTASTGETTFGWTKKDLDEQIIGHIIARAKKCFLTNWAFGSLTSDINTGSINIGHIVQ